MPDMTIDFYVYCAKCGDGLCNQTTVSSGNRGNIPYIHVEPCERCLDRAKDEGREEGYNDGFQEGLEAGSAGRRDE